jgi:transposase-like protein
MLLGETHTCDLFSVFLDGLSRQKVLSVKVGYIRGVIYHFLNIGHQIANRWIHHGGKVYFPLFFIFGERISNYFFDI